MADRGISVFQRLQHRIARGLNALPGGAQVFLSGRDAVVVDGLTLHPEVQLALALRSRNGFTRVLQSDVATSRRNLRHEARVHGGAPVEVGAVTEWVLETSSGPRRARHYVPEKPPAPAPLLVFFHGGGYVTCDLDTHDNVCRMLCRHARVQVLSVEYRLAPEAPFPAAVDDALAAFEWAREHAVALGADPARIGVGGDSNGGTLATVVAQTAVRDGTPPPALQLLICPAADRVTPRPSHRLFAEGFFLTAADLARFDRLYLPDGDPADPRVSPLLARDLSRQPPALILTAGFDPLRDEGEAYVAALESAGNRVVFRRFDRLSHAFANMTGVARVTHDAVVEIAHRLHDLFVTVGGAR